MMRCTTGVLLIVSLWAGGLVSCRNQSRSGLPRRQFRIGSTEVSLEIVATEKTRSRGLMTRDHLGENEGMLFVFESAEPRSFWMKLCLIPLSIAFLDQEGRILNILEMAVEATGTPNSAHRHYPSAGPARFAIEMNKKWFERNHVGPGVQVEIPDDVQNSAR